MRPNVDIPYALDGRVRDLAGERGLTRSESYELVLHAGLDALDACED